ncbi:STAS domain-containing protein [Derxia gummosa]|uniref:STAS domain-containing protein n=1 Tax=Derxia gummosa DSM 723 TaxID=1121388 RepID=A0A8B6X5T2_9BURK|nr:STAS domain-containing protein [Derxia gummosa]
MFSSLFGKKDRKRTESANSSLGRTVYPRSHADAALGAQARNDLQRRHQEEVTAKIDAIESEMVADLPALGIPRRPTPVPNGVALPDDVKREPDSRHQHAAPPDTLAMNESPSVLTADLEALSTDIFHDSLAAIEITDPGAGLPAAVEEAAIFYANGQNNDCMRALRDEITHDGSVAVVWYLLFEVLQQVGDHAGFDALAMDFVVRFERSPPVWRGPAAPVGTARKPAAGHSYTVALPASLVARVASDFTHARRALGSKARINVAFDAVCSSDEAGAEAVLDFLGEALRGQAQLILTGLGAAVDKLGQLMPTADGMLPRAVWLLRLELLRLLRRDSEFEDLSVEYAVAFEVSPPSFEPVPAHVIVDDRTLRREPGIATDPRVAELRHQGPHLEGDLLGRAPEAVSILEAAAALSDHVEVDCTHLRRVDFAAAGNLLNWLVSAQARGKHFVFTDVNQLVMALFRIMGIPGVAEVSARRI